MAGREETMGLILRAGSTVSWTRPSGLPNGFETDDVFTCQRGTSVSAPMEIATARFTGSGQPGRPALARLHTLRVNQRVTPVVLAIELTTGQVIIFGPNPEVAPTKPLPGGQVERLLQAVLDEPNPVAARSRLTGLIQALDSTAIPGIKNSGLFANHELRHGVPPT
jgi:hypothetical protein